MSWLYGQTWLWYLIAFLIGLLLAWLLLVRPQQRRLRALQAGSPAVAGRAPSHDAAPSGAAPSGAAPSGAAPSGAAVGGAAVGGAAVAAAATASAGRHSDTTPDAEGARSGSDEPTASIAGAHRAPDEPTEAIPDAHGGSDEPTASIAGAHRAPDEPTEAIPDAHGGSDEPTATIPEAFAVSDAPTETVADVHAESDAPTESLPVVDPGADAPTGEIPVVTPESEAPTEVLPAVDPALSTLDTANFTSADAGSETASTMPAEGPRSAAASGTAAGAVGLTKQAADDREDGDPVPGEPASDRPHDVADEPAAPERLTPDDPISDEARPAETAAGPIDDVVPDDPTPDPAPERAGTQDLIPDDPIPDDRPSDEATVAESTASETSEPAPVEPAAAEPATAGATSASAAAGAGAIGLVGAAGVAGGSAGPSATEQPYGPESARPLADGEPPSPEYTVKGNAESMLYHTTESPYYVRTRAEAWFTSAEAAEAAGFAPWNHNRREAAMQGLAAAPPTFTPGPYPGSALPVEDGSAPSPEFTVKGNADSMLFHTTDSPYYTRTTAEAWFRTAADAEAAGFTAYHRGDHD